MHRLRTIGSLLGEGRGVRVGCGLTGGREIGFDHFSDHVLEGAGAVPAEDGFDFGGVADELGGGFFTDELGIDLDVVLPSEADMGECDFAEVADGVEFAGGDDVIIGLGMSEHHVHGADVVGGVTPVALGIEVAEFEFAGVAAGDAGGGEGDFAGDELGAAAGAFVVVEDAGGAEEVVGLPVAAHEVEAGDFADAVGVSGHERR